MSFSSAMQKMQFDALVEMINVRNAKVTQVNAATGDRDSLAESIKESAEFADIRNQIAVLQDQLDAAVSEKVDAALANATGDSEGLLAEVKEIDTTLKPGITYYKKLYGDDAVEALPKQERVKGTRTGGGGGGGKRIRGYNVIVTIGDESEEFENFATAAKHLDVATATLQEQFYAKAGVEKLSDAPDEVTFGMSWDEVDEDEKVTTVNAVVKAYRTGPSGVPTKDEEPAVTEPSPDTVTEVDEDSLTTF